MKYLDPFEITPGFVDAVQVWSEYLVGERKKGLAVLAAFQFLNDMGIGTVGEAVPTDVLRKMRVLANAAPGLATANPRNTKRIPKFLALVDEVKDFFNSEYDVDFAVPDSQNAGNDWITLDSSGSLQTVTDVMATTYSTANDGLALIPAGYDNSIVPAPGDDYDYSKVPDEIKQGTSPASEYDVIGRDLPHYFDPPPPDATFSQYWRDAGGSGAP